MAIPRKPLFLLAALFLSAFQFFSVSVFSQSITSAEAKDNIGQSKTVTGVVMKVTTLPKTVAIDIDGVFPNAPFSAVIFNAKLPAFDKAVLESYQGKTVAITGKIATYKDKPQIVLEDPSQIVVTGDAAAAASASPAVTPAANQPATTAPAPTTTSATPAESPSPSSTPTSTAGNLLANPGFNKGKKEWDLPADADVIADGESQVLKIVLKADAPITIKQVLKAPIAKSAHFNLKFQAKLPEGSKLNENMTLHLGSSLSDGPRYTASAPQTPGKWSDIQWSGTGTPDGSLTFFMEIPAGTGTLLLDNFHLSTN